jgi:hypothetical protein
MRKMHARDSDSEDVYVILKVDNAAVISDARITQVIKNPLQYFLDGHMNISSDGVLRASWKKAREEL